MKFLLLSLCLLAGGIHAAPAAGTWGYWTLDNTLGEAFGGTSLTDNGTTPFATGTTPAPPSPNTYWAGPFTDTNYLNGPVSGFPQAEGSIAYTLSSDGGFKCPWIVGIDQNNRINGLTFGGSLYVQYMDDGTVERSITYAISNNTLYYVIVNWSATAVQLWVGTTPENIALRGENTTNVRKLYTPTLFRIGRAIPTGQNWGGYIGQFRVSNVTRTTWPVDTSGTVDDALSPYQWNINTPKMFPQILQQLLWLLTLPKSLPALEQDSRPVATAVAVQAARSRELYIAKEALAGRMTRTVTPTPRPTARPGTPTPTATVTPTPNKTVAETER